MNNINEENNVYSAGYLRIFALFYLPLGYALAYTLTAANFARNLAFFTIVYEAVVLFFVYRSGRRPTKESFFWMAVMLALAIPYMFWSFMEGVQVIALFGIAAYWTLSVTGALMEGTRTSDWIFLDIQNSLIWVPFRNFLVHGKVLYNGIKKGKKGEKMFALLLGILVSIPVLIIVLPLLASADAAFEKMIFGIFRNMSSHFMIIFIRVLITLPITAYLFGLVFGSVWKKNTDHFDRTRVSDGMRSLHRVSDVTVYTVLFIICCVYILFIGLQGRYLFSAFAGVRPEGFSYAEYARRGFFELCAIGALNIGILATANAFSKTPRRISRGLKAGNTALSVLTLLLLATAISKMFLYMSAYGLTEKRILTSTFLVWMVLVFVCLIVEQWKEIPLIRIVVIAGTILFCLLCVIDVRSCIRIYNAFFCY
jgi:hypothetical protein